MPRIIGLSGVSKSGKSTVAAMMKEHGYEEYAFADPLKKGVQAMFGLTDEQLWGNEKEAVDEFWNVTPRKLLQIIGAELFRDQLPRLIPEIKPKDGTKSHSIWVRSFVRYVISQPENARIVVSDVRFPDEVDVIRSLGGTVWEIRKYTSQEDVGMNPVPGSHISEQVGLENDFVLYNIHGKLDNLRQDIQGYLELI